MTRFEDVIDYVLSNEGELSENPNDSGGITKYGISLRFIRELTPEKLRKYGIFEPITDQTIRDLTLDQAKLIYRSEFWEASRFNEIKSKELAAYLFDMSVAHGTAQSIKLLQRAIWAIYRQRSYLNDDGVLGSKTIAAVNDIGSAMLCVLIATRASFYRLIAEKRPKDRGFLDGWLNRCYRI
ncbi:hypothetical protein KW791_00190 [Candidatus Parcubacteria bacterium]|nr:hypothetical protein [Candidatus Parcubacteria bacterium]